VIKEIERLYQKGDLESALEKLKSIQSLKRDKSWYELFIKVSVKLERWNDARKAFLYGYNNIDKLDFSKIGNELLESYKMKSLNHIEKMCNDVKQKYQGKVFS